MVVEIAGQVRKVCFAEAWREFEAAGDLLIKEGCVPGDVILVFLPQGWDGIAFFFGAMLVGCVPSFMPGPSSKQDPGLYWTSHRTLLERTNPAAIVTNRAQAMIMSANGLLPPGRRLVLAESQRDSVVQREFSEGIDAIALLQHSSGTTGAKKGVMLSHGAVLRQVDNYSEAIRATKQDVIVSWLPLYHDMGLIACLLMPAILGQTVILLDPFAWVSRPALLFQAITRHKGTLCWLPNFAFEHLVRTVQPDTSLNLSSMRAFIDCSEPCQVDSFHRFRQAFSGIGVRSEMLQVCYAMAETTFAVTQHRMDKPNRILSVSQTALAQQGCALAPKPGEATLEILSAGAPIMGAEVEIRDADGRALPAGSVGEICIRAQFLFDGYYRLREKTKDRLVSGWYLTKDRGFVFDGEVYVLGRMDDLIILNGRNFHAAEIEVMLNEVVGLKAGRNVAFGQFNSSKGKNELILVAELPGPLPAAEVEAAVIRQRVRKGVFEAIGIYPAEILLTPPGWLIKTTSGKIARGANAEKFQLTAANAEVLST